jgi:hypothetical protein
MNYYYYYFKLLFSPSQSWDIENLTISSLNPKPKKKGGKKIVNFIFKK